MNSIHNQSTCLGKFGERLRFAIVLCTIAGMAEAAPVLVYAKSSLIIEPSATPLSPVYDDPDAGGEED